MGAVAERGGGRLAAAAKGDAGTAAKAEGVARLIDDFEIPFDANGTVVENCHARAGHECLRNEMLDRVVQITIASGRRNVNYE